MSTPEGQVKKFVKQYLTKLGCWWFMPVQNGFGKVGIPDFVACVPVVVTPDMVGQTIGAFVAIETKAPGKEKTLTVNQQRNIDAINAAMGIAIVVSQQEHLPPHIHSRNDEGISCGPLSRSR